MSETWFKINIDENNITSLTVQSDIIIYKWIITPEGILLRQILMNLNNLRLYKKQLKQP